MSQKVGSVKDITHFGNENLELVNTCVKLVSRTLFAVLAPFLGHRPLLALSAYSSTEDGLLVWACAWDVLLGGFGIVAGCGEMMKVTCEKMHHLPEEFLEALKNGLQVILEGGNGPHYREEFFILHKLVQSISDLTAKILIRAHCVQLEILVAINIGIQGFLHPPASVYLRLN
ncbi:OBERON protein [Spatholobus suberectus]|nr:OBERON protein [Spatholobus suberectus]